MSDTTRPAPVLKTFSLSPGKISPGFSSPRTLYALHLTQNVESVTATAACEPADARITLNGMAMKSGEASAPVPLQAGRNVLTVEVASPDGTAKSAYTVKVFRSYPTPDWARLAEKNPWSPRDSAGEVVFNGRMWVFGGYTPALVSDVWSSPDGVNWTRGGDIPSEAGINIPVTFVYGGKMWVMSQEGKFFSSADGETWTLVTDAAPWKGRYSAGAVVFNDRMWVIGGSGGKLFNDVWSSTDGLNWRLETAEAPWSKRQPFSMMAVLDGKIWLMGGGITNYHPFRAYRDVWSSPDGRNWTQVTACAPWPARIWSSSVAFRNRLWVLTGFRAEPTWNNFSDVWYSADGKDWRQLETETIWSPRHEVSVYVFKDKLWAIGGNAWPLQNDTWVLDIPGLTFLSQPVVEEYVTARYSYQARADFNRSCQKVRYRLLAGPDWLALSPETGLLQGTPQAVGDHEISLEAFDAAGETARQTYTLHVIPLG